MAHGIRPRKKARQVTGDQQKIKKLDQLKKVTTKIDKIQKANQKRFEQNDKLFGEAQKLREQLGVD